MPELPEVETVRRSLAPLITGRTVTAVWRSPLALRREKPDARALKSVLVEQRLDAPVRRGKYLLLPTPRGGLLMHLGMSGQLTVTLGQAALLPHTHLRVTLHDGTELRYVDPRRFGLCRPFLGPTPPAEWDQLGPDPLSPAFTVEALAAALKRTTRAVKLMLLDQELVAGLGNIYVAEALFLAGIHPGRRAHQLRASQVEPLHRAIVAVLTQGVENRGTSLSDYVDAQGVAGNNQAFLKVYGRAGQTCVRCGGTVRGVVMGQRSTFYCPGCQPSRK